MSPNRFRSLVPAPTFLLLAVLATAAAPASDAPPATGAALAALVQGECAVRAAAGAPAVPLRLLDSLAAGGRVETGHDARLVVVFLTGERFELGPLSSGRVGTKGLDETKGTVLTLAPVSARVALAPLATPLDASRRAGAVRVRGEERPAMYPADGATLAPGDAVLRFGAVPGAEKYAVAVEDEAGNTVFSAQTGATRVVLPPAVLKEGATYFWRVRARGPGLSGTGREERFATLGPGDVRRWDEARANLAPTDPSLRSLLAATASSLGLRREACLAARPAAGAAPDALWNDLGCDGLGPFLGAE
ncbi:MAG: hypothetical protein U0529_07840 [Thermoanaerobaculia bacterium]